DPRLCAGSLSPPRAHPDEQQGRSPRPAHRRQLMGDRGRPDADDPIAARPEKVRPRSARASLNRCRRRSCRTATMAALPPPDPQGARMARTRLRLCATALAVAMLWLTPSAQQLRYPLLVSDTNAPGIDRGVRDNDAPRPPRTSRTVRVEPYLRGSVIVKFREGTGDTARAAMMRRVNAAPSRRLSDADFDVVTIDAAA